MQLNNNNIIGVKQSYDLLKFEEGFKPAPYYCSEGYPTIGYGTKLGPKSTPLSYYLIRVNEAIAELFLIDRVDEATRQILDTPTLRDALRSCDCDARRAIFISMAYQLGAHGLLKFVRFIKAVTQGDWKEAAAQMLDSQWAKQTPNRAKRHAEQMRTGKWCHEYRGQQ